MAYVPTTWVNGETPINDTNLNKMEQGIKEANDKIFIDSTQTEMTISNGYNAVSLNKPTHAGYTAQPLFIATSTPQKVIIMSHNASSARVYSEVSSEIKVTFTTTWLMIAN